MSKKTDEQVDPVLGFDNSDIQNTINKSEEFINKNRNILVGSVVALILAAAGIYYFTAIYKPSKEIEAQEAMFGAENYFEKDSFNLALNGSGEYLGFLAIADQFGSTKAGNLANYYAGIIYLKMGEFQNAIDKLNDYSGNDVMIRNLAIGAIGDAFAELGDNKKAIEQYKKAASREPNSFTTPYFLLKAGQLMEAEGEKGGALRAYQQIKDQFADSNEGMNIDKYIERASE